MVGTGLTKWLVMASSGTYPASLEQRSSPRSINLATCTVIYICSNIAMVNRKNCKIIIKLHIVLICKME